MDGIAFYDFVVEIACRSDLSVGQRYCRDDEWWG
jgi:hypothetical protein